MLKLPEGTRIFVATSPTDMRKQADGLSALVLGALGEQPMSGHLFVFFNRHRDRIRILFWDRDGYCVVSKRLERGRFRRMTAEADRSAVVVNPGELAELLQGIELPPKRKTRRILH